MSTARVARSVKLDPEIDARLTAYSLQAELEDIRAGRVASVSLDEAVKTLDLEG
ncbi:MAG: hypothetical protein E6212_05660 [Actinomyces sp.]|nr:hypothetical protein [Actinomyces sp.]